MLTFLELYQTLLGFVMFKLYTDVSLLYPPPLDKSKDEGAAGVGAFALRGVSQTEPLLVNGPSKLIDADVKTVSGKDVRQTIKAIVAENEVPSETNGATLDDVVAQEEEDDFVVQPSRNAGVTVAALPTLQTISSLPQSLSTSLFSAFTFWLSRETSRPIFEFLVRSFGGRIGWPASLGGGSPYDELDDSITHVIIDRPKMHRPDETDDERRRRQSRKFIQPQWVVDCINAGKILLEDDYEQGNTLPPHLSPFVAGDGLYDPRQAEIDITMASEDAEEASDGMNVHTDHEGVELEATSAETVALKEAAAKAVVNADPAELRVAELAAEAAGVDAGTFEKEVQKSLRKAAHGSGAPAAEKEATGEEDMNKMLMSNKQRKLYERMKFNQEKKVAEVRVSVARDIRHA